MTELIFIRHGQGVHNTNIPDRLNYLNPSLTELGFRQVSSLKQHFNFTKDDLFLVSPTVRTIGTVNILTSDLHQSNKYISPLVGPRMFPMPVDPEKHFFKCDLNYPLEAIKKDHPDFQLLDLNQPELWESGINVMGEAQFVELGLRMINWINNRSQGRAFIIAHDGTITCYRQILGEKSLSRNDFLGEAGFYSVKF